MIKNEQLYKEFERELIRKEPVDFRRNLGLMEALYQQARKRGAFQGRDPLEGIEVDIRLARLLNGL